jgi:hypothetical protein
LQLRCILRKPNCVRRGRAIPSLIAIPGLIAPFSALGSERFEVLQLGWWALGDQRLHLSTVHTNTCFEFDLQ